jgi:phosphatidate phosphatase APP1
MKPLALLLTVFCTLITSCGNRTGLAIPYPPVSASFNSVQQRNAALEQQIKDQVKPRDTTTVIPAVKPTSPGPSTPGTSTLPTSTTGNISSASPSLNAPSGKSLTPPTTTFDLDRELPRGPDVGTALSIKLYRSYGDADHLRIWGRVIEREDDSSASENDSKWQNFWRNIKNISVDEVEGVKVRFFVDGETFEITSNTEGMLEVEIHPNTPLSVGQHTLYAALVVGQKYYAPRVSTPLTIHPHTDQSLGVVSDIDDTLVRSDVSEKIKAVSRLLLNNAYNSEPIPGTAALMRALEARDGKQNGDVFYLSGSPLNYADRIYAYLDYQKYPMGPVNLKKWGFSENDDNPIQQSDYKIRKLRELFNFYPQKPFVLFGDSSESDAEIYTQIAQEFPGRVKAIFINNVNGQDPSDPRFAQVNLTTHAREAAAKLVDMGLLSTTVLEAVEQ